MNPVKTEIEQLQAEIVRHNRLYYVDARPEISDLEFDRLLKRLEQLEAEHPEFDSPDSPTHKVGGEPIDQFRTIEHRLPMLSIDNVYDEQELVEFGNRVQKLLPGQQVEYAAEYKIDGVAISLLFENGRLVQGVTRGDGRRGDDVTHNARTLLGVPLRLESDKPPAVLEVRGEAYIGNSDFAHLRAQQEKQGKEPFANPRNAAAGSLKLLDPKECAARRLRFYAHGVGYSDGVAYETHIELLEALKKLGVPTVPNVKAFADFAEVHDYAHHLANDLHSLDFEVDGIVVKVNSFKQRDRLGATSKAPRWLIAYKWEKYEAVTQVEQIDVHVGKTGTLTPFAFLKPVLIAGSTISKSSLHNRDEIERLGIKIGDWVVVEKAGKVIPHVVRVEEQRRDGSERPFVFPKKCPECAAEVVQDEGGVYIRCPNPNCPAQLRETLLFFASRGAMDIEGMGIKLVEQLIGTGLVKSLPDVFRLPQRRVELLALERMGAKSVDNLLAGIEAAKSRPLWRLLTGLNIRHVGSRNAQILAEHFGKLDRIIDQTEESLAEVEEIGPVIARSVHQFFTSVTSRQIVEELRELGLNFGTASERAKPEPLSDALAGKSFVVTGTLTRFTREEIQELIHAHGGKPAGSVSKKTSYVIAGENAGSKLDKATKFGVPIINEQEFLTMIEKQGG